MTLPIVCELTSSAIKAGRAGLLPGLAQRAAQTEMTADGYRLTFPPGEQVREVAAVIDAERQCCRWLVFRLDVPSGSGPLVLTLSGPEGARDFLSALFES